MKIGYVDILVTFGSRWSFTLKHWPAEARLSFSGDVTVPFVPLANKLTLVLLWWLVEEPLLVTVALCEGIYATLSDNKACDQEGVSVGNQESVRRLSGNCALSSTASGGSRSPHFMAEGNAGKLVRLSVTLKCDSVSNKLLSERFYFYLCRWTVIPT